MNRLYGRKRRRGENYSRSDQPDQISPYINPRFNRFDQNDFGGQPSDSRGSVEVALDELLNFSSINKINCNSKEASFNVVFAHNGKAGVVTFERGPSHRSWLHYGQANFFTDFKIGNQISVLEGSPKYSCTLPPTFNPWTMRISDDIKSEAQAKKEEEKKYLIYETYNLYNEITGPHIKSFRSDLKWIDNIWQHDQEKEKIIYKDADEEKGLVIIRDSDWDGGSVEKMHYLAIPRKSVISLRDLNNTHLDLLERIETIGNTKIKKKHGLSPSEYKAYIHYPPSFSHFHVHFTSINFPRNGEHPLSTVIDNIKVASDYYQKIRLPFVVTKRSLLGIEYHQKEDWIWCCTESLLDTVLDLVQDKNFSRILFIFFLQFISCNIYINGDFNTYQAPEIQI